MSTRFSPYRVAVDRDNSQPVTICAYSLDEAATRFVGAICVATVNRLGVLPTDTNGTYSLVEYIAPDPRPHHICHITAKEL